MDTTSNPHREAGGHFKDKDAIGHVIEAQAQGILSATEVHGLEAPGYLSAASDAARESAILLIMIWIVLVWAPLSQMDTISILLIFSTGWMIWKGGRSAWLGWFRLERLHRVLEQERFEIEHHRQQERDELRVLYATKGFEGKLLEEVLDVLMADNDRLLKVMVEEELGLSLASYEHPLKQGLGAALGTAIGSAFCLFLYILWPPFGLLSGCAIIIAASAALSAFITQNKIISAIIWNLGLGILASSAVYFLFEFISHK